MGENIINYQNKTSFITNNKDLIYLDNSKPVEILTASLKWSRSLEFNFNDIIKQCSDLIEALDGQYKHFPDDLATRNFELRTFDAIISGYLVNYSCSALPIQMGNALNGMIFQPPPPSYTRSDPHLHMIPTKQGYSIAAYYLQHSDAKFTIIFSHGNAEDIGHVFRCLISRIARWNVNFLTYDYAGYGLSGGQPSESNFYKNIEGVYDYVANVLGIPGDKIISYGRSIGSAPAIHLALNRKLAALILQCPVASILRTRFPMIPCTLPGDLFCNIDRVKMLKLPTLVMHGTEDEIVPIKASKQMVAKIPQAYYVWITGGSHNDLDFKFTKIIENAIQQFLQRVTNLRLEMSKSKRPCQLDSLSYPRVHSDNWQYYDALELK